MPVARLSSSLVAVLLTSTALVGIVPARAQGLPAGGQALPTGGHVVSGGVTIGAPSGGAMTITQSSQSAIVNWQGFSIGSNNRVDIRQPDAQSAILNRVTGDTPSTIAGQLNANGQVYLVNPNGITITRSGRVNAEGGFVASTLGIADEDFKAGRRQFRGSGASAKVTNHGTITVGRGGYAALIGGRVSNTGTIAVPMGKVGLGSGERATLDLSGDGFLQVQVPTNAKGRGALVSHSGTISADGGSVVLTAAAARDMARQAVNLSGTVEARAVSGRNGSITLSGGDGTVTVGVKARLDASGAGTESGGRVRVTGRNVTVAGNLDASGGRGGRISVRATEGLALTGTLSATGRSGQGGRVVATAPEMALTLARIDVSGATGGGVVRLGGGREGAGRLAHAQSVTIDAGTEIRADAIAAGTGGDVVVWSDASTRFAGTISARGGALSGNGGEAEVSSKGHLAYDGRTDLTAAKGAFGTLLLDPYNVTISSGVQTTGDGFAATGDDSVINAGTLLTALGSANVTVSTGTSGSQAGTITVAAPLAWGSGAVLTLQAAGTIALNGTINATAGGLTLTAGSGQTISATDAVSVGRFALTSGDWIQNAASLPGFAAGDFQVTGGSFLRASGGAGTSAGPYQLTDIYGVQGMGTSAGYRAASYQLAGDVDASGTVAWNGGAGFKPVGSNAATFTGSLDGAGRTITGLSLTRPTQSNVGLFGYLGSGGSVSNVGLAGSSVSGASQVGSLIGYSNGGTVRQSYATGSVSGSGNFVGGLIGYTKGIAVSQSYATGSVRGAAGVGGLIGGADTGSTVSQSYASGSVSGTSSSVGGLVGALAGTVSQSYATGSVVGTGLIGGLVGNVSGGASRVIQSYASGRVSLSGGSGSSGGLVGSNSGVITSSYWDKDSTGQTAGGATTGATGLTSAQARSASNYSGFDFTTVWYQAGDMRPILRSEAATADANGVIAISNAHQLQLMGANLAGQYQLTANIDASETAGTNAAGIFGTGGFVPVGNPGTAFTGTLDGAGRTITGLTIARPGFSYTGLIGQLNAGGSVSGVGLVGGSVTGDSMVGGLVGRNYGMVSQSYVTGSVSGASYVGGLVGWNNSTVNLSYATGRVTGSGESIGGLVGQNYTGAISRSYASGEVSGAKQVGGLLGANDGTGGTLNVGKVDQSYSTGKVTGTDYVGGLVGLNGFSTSRFGRISESYSSGNVTGSTHVGGFAGGMIGSGSSFVSSFWDKDSSGKSTGLGSSNVVGLTGLSSAGSSARSSSSYTNWDFTSTWYQAGDMRPILRAEAAAADASGVVAVSNLHQLQLMGTDLAGSYRLASNIDARETAGTNAAGIFGSGGFVPVGDLYVPFTGRLDGAGRAVTGLTINRPSSSAVGLIGALGSASTITDIALVGGYVVGNQYTGGLVGLNFGTITRASNTGPVSGGQYTGGLVGQNLAAAITGSSSTGLVTGSNDVGGLVGANGGTIVQSYATGPVFGTDRTGGLIGTNDGFVYASYAGGDVNGRFDVGGLIGQSGSFSQLGQAYATGNVGGTSAVGGVTGRAGTYGLIFGVYATGAVSGQGDVGALVGAEGGNVYGAYWNVDTAGVQNPYGNTANTNATGLTTAQMQDRASFRTNYPGFSFEYVWAPPNQAGQGGVSTAHYPELYGVSPVIGVTPVSVRRPYNTSNPNFVGIYAGLRPGDFVTNPGIFSTSATLTSPVGTYDVTASDAVVTGSAGRVYRVVTVPNPYGLTIIPATVTASLVGTVSKTYDGTTASLLPTNYSLSGVAPADTPGVSVAGTGAIFDSAGAGTGKTVTVTGLGLSGTAAGNYVLASTTASAAIGTITPAPLTVTANAASKTYDGQAYAGGNGVAYAGLVNGETAAVLGGTLTYGGAAQGAVNAGSYAITPSGLTSGNYAITFADGALSVNQAPLTVTANAASKTYDGQAYTGGNGVSYAGLVNGEGTSVLGGSVTYGGTAQGAVNAGSYAITPSGLTAGNYAITYADGVLTVNKAPLTASLGGSATKTYDGTATAPLGAITTTLSGIVGSDTVTAAGSGATYDTAQAGTGKAVTVSGLALAGAGAGNYQLAATTTSGSIGTITPGPLTVTARAAGKTYDGQAYAGGNGVTYAGFVNGEGASVLGGSVTYAGTAQSAVNAGSYTIAPSGLTSGNYAITFADGALSVYAKTLAVTIGGVAAKVYDGNAVAGLDGLTYTLSGATIYAAKPLGGRTYIQSGVVGTDAVTVAGSGATYDTAQAGTGKAVTVSGLALAGAGAGNYQLAATTTSGLIGTITPGPLTVTAKAASKTYDGQAFTGGNGVTYAGFVNGETASVLGGTVSYGGTAQGAVNAGSYAITPSGLTSGNYAISFANGALTVGKASLTASLAGTATKVYDGTGAAPLGSLTYGLSGRVGTDAVTVAGTAAAYGSAQAGTGKTVTVSGLSLSGAASGNYALTSTTASAAIGAITPAPLTVTANAASKTYDGQAFTGGNGVSYAGLVNGETGSALGGTLTYGGTAQGAVNAGSYAITPSGLTSANYAVSFADGALNVGKASLTASLAGTATKVYDGTGTAPLGSLTY
ncbi:filamentous hemagglutinin family N-terminal domain-containing protein, partial [Methylobacterium sp. 174MFSha1.1]|uniref:beta strand repeat-containing protein n=1 Tax=Methylobacterium sp. 174MFSha1.1 TaxID=1502749 RepID=UPI0008ED9B39